jgi:hypothetical protein
VKFGPNESNTGLVALTVFAVGEGFGNADGKTVSARTADGATDTVAAAKPPVTRSPAVH